MTEEKRECPSYNINVGVATEISTLIKIKTFKYHPYGLEEFRKDIIDHVDNWQSKGLQYLGHDQLTHAWRTPWDTHIRYPELMGPLAKLVNTLVSQHSPQPRWFLKDCWISEYTNNSGANRHNHGMDSMGWSFCYYIKVPDSGPAFTLCDLVENANYSVNVAEGDLLLFRHPLEHQVFPATDRRIIISGNIVESCWEQDIMAFMYDDPESIKNNINSISNHDVDVDDWSNHVVNQKFNSNIFNLGGY